MNPFERYPYSSRIKNKISELFGIVQEDGTTSVVQNDIDTLSRTRDMYQVEINRIIMQIAYLKNSFVDRKNEYEDIVKVRVDNHGNRILPYGPLSEAYTNYQRTKGNIFTESEFNNIYSNLVYLIQAEQKIKELDRKINIYSEYQKRI